MKPLVDLAGKLVTVDNLLAKCSAVLEKWLSGLSSLFIRTIWTVPSTLTAKSPSGCEIATETIPDIM